MFASLAGQDEEIDVINQNHAKTSIRDRAGFDLKSDMLT